MVFVTAINGAPVAINSELIEYADATPDTVITLTTGNKFIVRETLAELAEKVLAFRHAVLVGRYPGKASQPHG
jgi:flagellar protein FlbD